MDGNSTVETNASEFNSIGNRVLEWHQDLQTLIILKVANTACCIITTLLCLIGPMDHSSLIGLIRRHSRLSSGYGLMVNA